jgi:hypothetical protein
MASEARQKLTPASGVKLLAFPATAIAGYFFFKGLKALCVSAFPTEMPYHDIFGTVASIAFALLFAWLIVFSGFVEISRIVELGWPEYQRQRRARRNEERQRELAQERQASWAQKQAENVVYVSGGFSFTSFILGIIVAKLFF